MNGINGYNKEINNNFKGAKTARGSYEEVEKISYHILKRTEQRRPKVGIICGSGFGSFADSIEDSVVFKYEDIPYFPCCTVPGHAGRLVIGSVGGKDVVCMQGRFHMYEGYPMEKVAIPVRVMKMLGVEILIVTNASGGLNRKYKIGDVMIIKDHINIPGITGINPLVGKNEDRFGPRFPAMTEAYDRSLRKQAKETMEELQMDYVQEGVYAMQVGPCFETVAESRMLQMLGADVTGMSTVPEVIVACHCGLKVLGISLVTNMCVVDYDTDKKVTHEDVLASAKRREIDMKHFLFKLIGKL